jgi:hypothetical protein
MRLSKCRSAAACEHFASRVHFFVLSCWESRRGTDPGRGAAGDSMETLRGLIRACARARRFDPTHVSVSEGGPRHALSAFRPSDFLDRSFILILARRLPVARLACIERSRHGARRLPVQMDGVSGATHSDSSCHAPRITDNLRRPRYLQASLRAASLST